MIDVEYLIETLVSAGVTLAVGVPCSSLGGLIAAASDHPSIHCLIAANEGDAIAIAAGAQLAGQRVLVFLQNSGVGNAVSPLTSLISTFQLPLLMLVGWRGRPDAKDEAQHELMGAITPSLLNMCGVETLIADIDRWDKIIERWLDISLVAPVALLCDDQSGLNDSTLSYPLGLRAPLVKSDRSRFYGSRPTRIESLDAIVELAPPNAAIVSTTGKCSRELFTIADRPQHFYQIGSMGCASSIGLGIALTSSRPVIIIDGDGAALMRLGALATIAAEMPSNLIHIVLDNETHDSTGGQPTVSHKADLSGVAEACGYPVVFSCESLDGFRTALARSLTLCGPVFLHAKILPGSITPLARPTMTPRDVARRFSQWLCASV